MKASEFRKMTPEELNEQLENLKKDLFHLRMQHATSRLSNPLLIRETRHNIARVKMVLSELENADSKKKSVKKPTRRERKKQTAANK